MKDTIHPEYRYVVFRDVSCNFEFLTRSCAAARETTTFEGQEYPLIPIDVSSKSHPFYTGTQKLMDTEGRVQRFQRKYGFKGGVGGDQAEGESPAEPANAEAEGETPAE
jgi:large subunit ribosomal protein L31